MMPVASWLRVVFGSGLMGIVVAALCAWLGAVPEIGFVAFVLCVMMRFGEDA